MKKFLQNHVLSFLFLLLNLLSFPLFLLPFLYTKSSSMIIPISGYELMAFYEDTGSYLSYGSKSFLFLLISFIGLSLTSLLSLFASRNFKKNTPCHRFDLLLNLYHLCNLYPDILPSRVTKSDSSQLRILLFLNIHTTFLYQQNSSVLPPKKEKLPERGIILTPKALITMFSEEIISLLFCLSCILSPHTDVKTLLHHHSLLKRVPFRYAQIRTGISLFYRSNSK